MASSVLAVPDTSSENVFRKFAGLLPGIALLFAVGYGGKVIERAIATYGKAHHLALPNIEYVLWAIVIGLVIANTVGVPKIFQPGLATYEFWLKAGIVLLGSRFLLGDVLKLGGVSLALVFVEIVIVAAVHDGAGARVWAEAEADHAARGGLIDLRRVRDYCHAGRDRCRRRRRFLCDRRDSLAWAR